MQMPSLPSFLVDKPIIPVVTLTNAAQAVPLAKALAAGGIDIVEITLRTEAGIKGIAEIRQQLPDFIVGAGTVTSVTDMQTVAELGTHFAVSPGITGQLAEAAAVHDLFYLPGVITPSEIMLAISHKLHYLKFFPAEASGGSAWLKQTASVFPHLKFCATGGIHLDNINNYFQQSNLFAIGGSWLVTHALLENADWQTISANAKLALSSL